MTLTWNFLLEFDYSKDLPEQRTEETLNEYKLWKLNLEKNNEIISDVIYKKYLKNKSYHIEKNSFPYLTEKNVFHYVLWINDSYKKNITNKKIMNIVIKKMKEINCSGYICFENTSNCKSIKEILHYQVFYRKC